MKRTIGFAAALLLVLGASAIAAERPGASSMSPGHEMQNSKPSSRRGRPSLTRVTSRTIGGARSECRNRKAPRNILRAIG